MWTTGPGGVRIVTAGGKVLGMIKLGEVVANVAFGEEGHAAWFTASTSIYRLKVATVGELPLYQR